MQELERMISIYHVAFIIFLILTIVFLVVSVVLFFRFDIRGIFDMRTGRGARKTIQKMQELNDQTGKLRQDVITNTPVNLSPKDRIAPPPTEKRLVSVQEDSQKTELLSGQTAAGQSLVEEGSQETTLLHDYNETTVLSQGQMVDAPQPAKKNLPGAFNIDKEIMWVHTDEII